MRFAAVEGACGDTMSACSTSMRLAGILAMAACASLVAWVCAPEQPAQAKEPELDALANDYAKEIRPLILRYCQRCHGGTRKEADINLLQMETWADVRKHARTWQKVREMLESGQMPPQEARQPTDAERTRLRKWVKDYLTAEAQARAGDPGPVVLRRLSNAEYTYTLRDLTAVESLQPAREFPVDGAAGEGFTNTG